MSAQPPKAGSPPAQMTAAMFREQDRALKAFVAIINKWPEWREWAAFALLGSAVATCDSLGCDVEGWIANLRRKQRAGEQVIPDVIVPMKEPVQ